MAENKQFLDYSGFKIYHDELVKNLRNLTYDPQRMFESKEDLVKKDNWSVNKYGQIEYRGLKEGLIVTIDNQIWQLVDPELFKKRFTTIGIDMSTMTAEDLGWKIVGSTTEFEVDGHTLKLYKNE